MSFVLWFIDFLLFLILSYDTANFLYYVRRKSESGPLLADYSRLIYSWIFWFCIKGLCCYFCGGFLGGFVHLGLTILNAFVVLPILNGTNILKRVLIDQNALSEYIRRGILMVQEKMEQRQ